METLRHSIHDLFAQLGLPSETEEIDRFIRQHSPLAGEIALHQAPFWTPSQANFLRSELIEDADWAEVVDRLNTRLRAHDSGSTQ